MKNWTKVVLRSDRIVLLPVPSTKMECLELLHKTEHIQRIFGASSDSLDAVERDLNFEGLESLRLIDPEGELTDEDRFWLKIWQLEDQVLINVQQMDVDRIKYLKQVCESYQSDLVAQYELLTGEKLEDD